MPFDPTNIKEDKFNLRKCTAGIEDPRFKGLTEEEIKKAYSILTDYRPMTIIKDNPFWSQQYQQKPTNGITMNSKTYLAVANGNVIASDENLDSIKKIAAEFTYNGKASIVIYQPILEISPKYDTVETSITMK